MLRNYVFALLLGLSAFVNTASFAAGIDPVWVEEKLKSADGLVGWIHAVVPSQGLYVFTVRDPKDFFINAQFPLIGATPEVAAAITKLRRHDKIKLFGQFADLSAPQRHIQVTKLEILEVWQGDVGDPYQYEVQLPQDLIDSDHLVGRVHVVEGEGRILVVEYRDVILPIFINRPDLLALTKTLYRGDRISLSYKVRRNPGQPTHLMPNPDVKTPLKVLSRIVDLHNKPAFMLGTLAQFPQSPQVIFNVYALQVKDDIGVNVDYTLVNFDHPEVFKALREKLETVWQEHRATAKNGRNKLYNPKVLVVARGHFNVVSPAQANPQIVVESVDDVEIIIQPDATEVSAAPLP